MPFILNETKLKTMFKLEFLRLCYLVYNYNYKTDNIALKKRAECLVIIVIEILTQIQININVKTVNKQVLTQLLGTYDFGGPIVWAMLVELHEKYQKSKNSSKNYINISQKQLILFIFIVSFVQFFFPIHYDK